MQIHISNTITFPKRNQFKLILQQHCQPFNTTYDFYITNSTLHVSIIHDTSFNAFLPFDWLIQLFCAPDNLDSKTGLGVLILSENISKQTLVSTRRHKDWNIILIYLETRAYSEKYCLSSAIIKVNKKLWMRK